jgi:hypothetical protein
MKKFYFLIFSFLLTNLSWAQKKCDFDVNVSDSLGTLRSTKEYIMYEKKFGSNEQHMFFSLSNSNGIPFLNVQFIKKNQDFIPVSCLYSGSKIYLQLQNGKIVTLLYYDNENCGTLVQSETTKQNVRILSGNFLFMKDSFEELKKSPVTLMRIKFGVETEDFLIKSELTSELTQSFYRPETYFMEYLHCVENDN